MRLAKYFRKVFAKQAKLRQSVRQAVPLFVAEPLEARRLLSGTLISPASASPPEFVQQAELTASDGKAYDYFGWTVAVSGNTVAAIGGNAVYVFTEPGTGWGNMTQTAELTASNGDQFTSVAIDGNTVVAGAAGATVNGHGSQGAVYVFTEPGSGWANMTQTAKLTASDGTGNANLGSAVGISSNTVVTCGEGPAYVFTRGATGWKNMTQTAELTATDGGGFSSVAISGNTVVAGNPDAEVGIISRGAAYVFTEPSTGWANASQTAKLTASVGAAHDWFGSSVAISGNTVAVGAPEAPCESAISPMSGDTIYLPGSGEIYLFTEPSGGWVNTSQGFGRSDPNGHNNSSYNYDSFGGWLALSGNSLAVGGNGGVYIYSALAGWTGDYLTGYGPAAVSGSTLVAGAAGTMVGNNKGQGAVYVFAGDTIAVAPPVNQTASFGQSQSITLGSFTRSNGDGGFDVDVNWGDGSPDSTFDMSTAGTIPATAHTFSMAGNLTVTVTVTDGDEGNANSATFGVTVLPGPAAPVYSNLTSPQAIGYGTPTVAFSGTISAGTLVPPGTEAVAITLNDVTQDAAIDSSGNFSSTFSTSVLPAAVTPYQITYSYAGDANFNSVTDDTTTALTVNKAAPFTTWSMKTLDLFNGTNGSGPMAGLTLDSAGDLFGTTSYGGANGDGTVFEIVHGNGGIITLASFNGTDGQYPFAAMVLDSAGDLFGSTNGGGADGDGTVFEIANGSGVITTLASFNGTNGWPQMSGVILDSSGNIFGTTDAGDGTVFEIAKGSGVITTLATFNGTDGQTPEGVVMDSSGNLFGSTQYGGTEGDGTLGDGTIFEIANGTSVITTLATFNFTNGWQPSSVILDSVGDIFGATLGNGHGTVFEIIHGSGTVTTLATFNGTNGCNPGTVTLDANGNIFGTCWVDNNSLTENSVFEIVHASGVITTLASFYTEYGVGFPLVIDSAGNIYAATEGAGINQNGTVFELAVATTGTAVTSSSGWSASGQSVTFTATVTPATGTGETGTVQFQIDGGNVGSPVALTGNTASYTTAALGVGSHSIAAVYSGDSNFLGSTSPTITQNVTGTANSTVTVASSNPSASYGQQVTFTATVTSDAAFEPTGTIQFQIDGGNAGSPVALSGGTASYTASALSDGNYAVAAVYSGDNNFAGTASSTFVQEVVPATPSLNNLSSSSVIKYGTATVTVSGNIAAGTTIPPDTETVAVTLNGVTQNATINSKGNFSSTFNTSTLPASATPYQVTYTYAGDANFNTVTDNTTTTLTVTGPASLSGTIYADTNDSGVWNSADPGLPDVMVYLDTNNNTQLDAGEISVNTDANGNYVFNDLPAGNYTVREVAPGGYAQTYPAVGYITVTAPNGQAVTGENFLDAPTGNATAQAVYRLYSPVTLEHLYTSDPREYNTLESYVGTWNGEGQVFNEYSGNATVGGVADEAYYRLYNPSVKQHLWTTDDNEYTTLATEGWNQEGMVGYVFPTAVPAMASCTPLYRMMAPQVHLWTTTLNEYDTLQTDGWTGEGIIGYVVG